MKLLAMIMVIVCVYGSPVKQDTGESYKVQGSQDDDLTKRFILDTDFDNLPVYHVGSSPCEPVSSSCYHQYATTFHANGNSYSYCCSENHKPHVTVHPNGIECDC